MADPASTRAELLARATRRLASAGVEAARGDARLLLAHALREPVARLLAYPEVAVGPEAADHFERLIGRRAAREPVSRILGVREFWSREFRIDGSTLDPRPESEILVATCLERLRLRTAAEAGRPSAGLRLLDLGTGSGCLLLTLLAELPGAIGVGVDRSLAALGIARDNAIRLGLADRTLLLAADWMRPLAGRFDVVVSNPPYIARREIAETEPEVRLYDPPAALDGGEDGLAAYRAIVDGLPGLLSPRGTIVALEVGAGQAADVSELVGKARIRLADGDPTVVPDLSGVPRCVAAWARSLE